MTARPADRAGAARNPVLAFRLALTVLSLGPMAISAWAADSRVIQLPQRGPGQVAPPGQIAPLTPVSPPAPAAGPAIPQPSAAAAAETGQPPSEPADKEPNPEPDRRGTADAPLIVQLQNPPTAAPPAGENAAEARRRASVEWSLLALAAGVVGLAVLQLLAVLFQGVWLRRTVKLAERSLQELERALIVGARLEATRLVRHDRVVAYRMSLVFTNAGRTPAKNLVSNGTFVTFEDEVPEDFDYRNRAGGVPGFGVIGPNVAFPLNLDVAVQDVIDVRDKKKVLLIYGWVEYDDLLSRRRQRTEFCGKLEVAGNSAAADGIGGIGFELWGKYNAIDDDCVYAPGRNPVGDLPAPAQPPPMAG